MKKPICMECEHFIHKQKLKGYDGYCEVLKQFTVLSMGCSEFSEGRNKIYKKAPTIDAVEVVRCKHCKYFEPDLIPIPYFEGDGVCCHEHWKSEEVGFEVKEIDFCSYGERKENVD